MVRAFVREFERIINGPDRDELCLRKQLRKQVLFWVLDEEGKLSVLPANINIVGETVGGTCFLVFTLDNGVMYEGRYHVTGHTGYICPTRSTLEALARIF